jgi:hypothetical protein
LARREERPPDYTGPVAFPDGTSASCHDAAQELALADPSDAAKVRELLKRAQARNLTIAEELVSRVQRERAIALQLRARVSELENDLETERERRARATIGGEQLAPLREAYAQLAAENEALRTPTRRDEPVLPVGNTSIERGPVRLGTLSSCITVTASVERRPPGQVPVAPLPAAP